MPLSPQQIQQMDKITGLGKKSNNQANPLINIGKDIAGGAANLLPMAGNIAGSKVGEMAGVGAGSLVPVAGETGIPEVIGGLSGMVTGGSAGDMIGEWFRQQIRQNVLKLDPINPITNKKALEEAGAEGAFYGLLPFGNSGQGFAKGFLRRAVAGGGINGASTVVNNLLEGKNPVDNVGWQSFLGGLFNGVIGGPFDREMKTIQIDSNAQPTDLFQAAKTDAQKVSEELTKNVTEKTHAIRQLLKVSGETSKNIQANFDKVIEGKTANIGTIKEDLQNIIDYVPEATTSIKKMVKNIISRIDKATININPQDIGAGTNDFSGSTTIGEGQGTKYVRMGGVKPGESGPPGYLKEVQKKGESSALTAAETPKQPTAQQLAAHQQRVDKVAQQQQVPLKVINDMKKTLSKVYSDNPAFKSVYSYLKNYVEQQSGEPQLVEALNRAHQIEILNRDALNKSLEKISQINVSKAIKTYIEKGDETGLKNIQKEARNLGSSGGMIIAMMAGHFPFVGSMIGGRAAEASVVGAASIFDQLSKLSNNIENKLGAGKAQIVPNLIQQLFLRSAQKINSSGNIGGKQ